MLISVRLELECISKPTSFVQLHIVDYSRLEYDPCLFLCWLLGDRNALLCDK